MLRLKLCLYVYEVVSLAHLEAAVTLVPKRVAEEFCLVKPVPGPEAAENTTTWH